MDKKQLILEAALKLFVEFGFHGTPTSKIAEEAGVANGTLFHYFSTKDELVVALYSDIKSRMVQYIEANTKTENSFKETIKGQYLASLYWALDNQKQFLFVEQFKTSPFLSLIAPDVIEKSIKPFHEMFRKGMETNEIKLTSIDFIFILVNSHIHGINQYLISNKFSQVNQHQIIGESFDLLWKMLT